MFRPLKIMFLIHAMERIIIDTLRFSKFQDKDENIHQ